MRKIEILFFAALSLIPLLWFKNNSMVIGLDSGYPLDFTGYFWQRSYTWLSSQNFGSDYSTYMGFLPLHGIQFFLSLIHVPYFAVQKVTFIFWFFAMSMSMYVLSSYIFKKPDQWISRIVSVLIYVLNFYILSFWFNGSQTTFSAYILLPLVITILLKYLNDENGLMRSVLLLNISYFVFNAGGVLGLSLLGPAILAFIYIILFFLFTKPLKQVLNKTIKLLIFCVPFFLVYNSYFLLPFLWSFTNNYDSTVSLWGGTEGIFDWTNFVSKFDSYINLFRLQGDNNWYTNRDSFSNVFLTNPILIFASFLFPIASYAGLITAKDRDKKMAFLIFGLLLVGILFSAGTHDPLGFVYTALLKYIPGFMVFRSAYYKFIPLVYLSNALLIGFFVYHIKSKLNHYKKYFFIAFVFLFVFFYHYPFYDSKNFQIDKNFSTMNVVPEYVRKFSSLGLLKNIKYRILVLPPLNAGYSLEGYDWGYYGSSPIFPGLSAASFVINNAFLNTNERILVNTLYGFIRKNNTDAFRNLAAKMNIKYILLTRDIVPDIESSAREAPDYYQDFVDKNLTSIWKEGKWELYEIINIHSLPIIYTINQVDNFSDKTSDFMVGEDSQFISSTTIKRDLIHAEINDVLCISCGAGDEYQVNSPQVSVYPGSFLYAFKLNRNNKNRNTGDINSRVGNLLGLSLIRMSEMNNIEDNKFKPKFKQDWLLASDLLFGYWNEIYGLVQNHSLDENYKLQNIILSYLISENSLAEKIFYKLNMGKNDELKEYIRKTVFLMKNVRSKLLAEYSKYDWDKTYLYDLSRINSDGYLFFNSSDSKNPFMLDVSIDNKKITMPTSHKDSVIPLGKISKSAKRLQVNLINQKNYFENPRLENERSLFADKNCLIGEIKDYKWSEKYIISAKIKQYGEASAYIASDDTITLPNNDAIFLNPHNKIIVKPNITGNFRYYLSGKPNTRRTKVYLCTDKENDVNSIFTDVKITKDINPQIIFSSTAEIIKTDIGEIKYAKESPTEYTVKLYKNIVPKLLVMAERYSESWKLFDKNTGTEIPAKHIIINGYANAWELPEKYDNIVIRFTQQNIFNTGVLISLISIFLSVPLLLKYLKI